MGRNRFHRNAKSGVRRRTPSGSSRHTSNRHPRLKPGADHRLKKVFAGIGVPQKTPFKPDPYQLQALNVVQEADCLVTAPTGAGKTWIAEQTIEKVLGRNQRAWYACPLKALSNAKYKEFSETFGAHAVGILTGDRKENAGAPLIVGTTEILRNQLYDAMHSGTVLAVDFVVLDEAHFLGDPERGVVWEEIMIYLPSRIPLLLLSATIGNADQIAAWLTKTRKRPCGVVTAHKRPVPLYPLFLHPTGTVMPLLTDGSEKKRRLDKKVRAFLAAKPRPRLSPPGRLPIFGDILQVLRKNRLLPAIFFLKSRADCDGAIEICKANRIQDPERAATLQARIAQLAEQSEHLANHKQRPHLEELAVAAHHSGQLPAWKIVVETLMTEGLLDAVFATSTVAAGVNFPARTVVFLNTDRFNGQEFLPLTPTEFHQMTGRAGRRGMDRIGFAMALPGKYLDLRLAARLVTAPPSDVLSQIRINFSMVLNLLLSHTPDQIEELLKRSFAAYIITHGRRKQHSVPGHEKLWNDFLHHLKFLQDHAYVDPISARLTPEGLWASQLRVDQPLLIAEGFRRDLFPEKDPALLAAVVAAFVNEREASDRLEGKETPNRLTKAFNKIYKGLRPFARDLLTGGFACRQLYLRPAAAMYAWASERPWSWVVTLAELEEGSLAMLVLRTADHLRHICALGDVFPEAAETAAQAIEKIMRDPVITELAG